ncbi:MAG: hypothetical protein Q9187_007629, partial [Circinaria calcarea]
SESAKMLAIFHATGRGTLYLYQGQEIGMTNTTWTYEELRDIDEINFYNFEKAKRGEGADMSDVLKQIQVIGRDNARTPMQWNDCDSAGFTTGRPWIKVNEDYKEWNVQKQQDNPTSVLSFWKTLLKIRKQHTGLVYGIFKMLDRTNEEVYAYTRTDETNHYLVICSFSKKEVTWEYPVERGNLLISNYSVQEVGEQKVKLRPYEARVGRSLSLPQRPTIAEVTIAEAIVAEVIIAEVTAATQRHNTTARRCDSDSDPLKTATATTLLTVVYFSGYSLKLGEGFANEWQHLATITVSQDDSLSFDLLNTIPELVAITMGFLREDGYNLVNCTTVNRMWAEEATNVIWEWLHMRKKAGTGLSVSGDRVSLDFCPILLDMPRERLEWYAKKVRKVTYVCGEEPSQRKLDLDSGTTMHQQLSGVAFPRLKSLHIQSVDLAHSLIVPYLQENLQDLSLFDRPCSDFVLEQLAENCPILEELLLGDPQSLTGGALLKFLQKCTSLTRLRVRSYMRDVYTSAVFYHLANRSTLTCLEFASRITESMTLAVISASTNSFSSLRVLHCNIDASAMENLFSQLPNLVDVFLDVKGHGRHLLRHIAQSTKLQSISIFFEFDTFLDQQDIIKLANNCQAVQSLYLLSENKHPSFTPTAETFQKSIEEVTRRLTSLAHLELRLSSPMPVNLLRAIDTPCSCLASLGLNALLSLSDLHLTTACTFPNLRILDLRGLDNSQELPPSTVSEIIRHHAPLLEDLDLRDESAFNSAVTDILGISPVKSKLSR